jgi:hypothetical protein
LEQVLPRLALTPFGFGIDTAELSFKHPIDTTDLLFGAELLAVPRKTTPGVLAMLPGGIRAALESALIGKALLPFKEKLFAFPPTLTAFWIAITCHRNYSSSNPTLFRGTATVVRNRRHISNSGNPNSQRRQSADSRLAPRARALHAHFQIFDPTLHRGLSGSICRYLRSKGGAFPRPFKACRPGRCPRKGVPLTVGDGDDRVIKARLNVGDAVGNVFLDSATRLDTWFSH